MIRASYDEVVQKIQEKAGLTRQEIEERVAQKLKQLSGLISKEGAAHIIANEVGVRLYERTSGRLQVKNILNGMRDVEVLGKVVALSPAVAFKKNDREGSVSSFLIADETGSVRIVLWNDQAKKVESLQNGELVKIVGGYVRERNNIKEVHLNDRSKLIVNPPGETLGEIHAIGAQRRRISEISDTDSEVELMATIVQVFEPRFFEICPQCGKRARPSGEGFSCEQHGPVVPLYSYVFNMFLDDGTDTIRTVCFRNQAQNILRMKDEDVLVLRDNPQKFDAVRTELLGLQVRMSGRVVMNSMFNRRELIASHSVIDPNPEQEIEQVSKEIEKQGGKVPVRDEESESLPLDENLSGGMDEQE